MKYTIKSTKDGCVETLKFSDGSKFTKRSEKIPCGCRSLDKEFTEQLDRRGFCEEILIKVHEMFEGFLTLDFMKLHELEDGQNEQRKKIGSKK